TGSNPRYTLASTLVTIPQGATIVPIPITLLAQTIYENTETIVLTISAATGAQIGTTSSTTISLTGSLPPPQVSWSAAAQTTAESTASASLSVSLNYASENPITVAYVIDPSSTAVKGVNYALSAGTMTIPALATSAKLNVNVLND